MSLAREEEAELLNKNFHQNEALEESPKKPDLKPKTNQYPSASNHLNNQSNKNVPNEINNSNQKRILNNSQIQINDNCHNNNSNDINSSRLVTKLTQNCENEEKEKTEFTSLSQKNKLFFENKFDCKVNKNGFYLRFFICVIGLFFIGLNSLTNCLVTEEESEGMKDKLIESLTFLTEFLLKNSNIYARALPIAFAVLFDAWVVFGIFTWIFLGKSNRLVYSTILFFSLMVFLQNLFLIEMPLVKGNYILFDNVYVNSFFLNFTVNKNAYYEGHVGFLLMILFEIYQNQFKVLFYFGLLYLVNLIAYLMAMHSTNSLCIISGILAALYFDKISEIFICKYFDVIEIFKKAINDENDRDNKQKISEEPLQVDSKAISGQKNYMSYDENYEECEKLKKDDLEEHEKYTLNKKENNMYMKVGVNKVLEDRLNEKIKMNDFLLINKEQKQGINIGNSIKVGKKRSFDYNKIDNCYQEVNFNFDLEEDKENKDWNGNPKLISKGDLGCFNKDYKEESKGENLNTEIQSKNEKAYYSKEEENEAVAKRKYLNPMKAITA